MKVNCCLDFLIAGASCFCYCLVSRLMDKKEGVTSASTARRRRYFTPSLLRQFRQDLHTVPF